MADELNPQAPKVRKAPKVRGADGKCGHVNRHYTGAETLACILDPHGPDVRHQCPYLNKKTGKKETAFWSDMAGTPVPS